MRIQEAGNDACRRLPVLLRVHGLQGAAASAPRRLLRILFLWFSPVPVDAEAIQYLSIVRPRRAVIWACGVRRSVARHSAKEKIAWLMLHPVMFGGRGRAVRIVVGCLRFSNSLSGDPIDVAH